MRAQDPAYRPTYARGALGMLGVVTYIEQQKEGVHVGIMGMNPDPAATEALQRETSGAQRTKATRARCAEAGRHDPGWEAATR